MPIYLQICAIFSSKAGPSKVCLAESCQRTRQNLIKPELKFSESLCDIIQFFISPLSAFCSTFFLLLIFYSFSAFYFSAEQTSIGVCYYFWFCFNFFFVFVRSDFCYLLVFTLLGGHWEPQNSLAFLLGVRVCVCLTYLFEAVSSGEKWEWHCSTCHKLSNGRGQVAIHFSTLTSSLFLLLLGMGKMWKREKSERLERRTAVTWGFPP